jgi:hypothetical protein
VETFTVSGQLIGHGPANKEVLEMLFHITVTPSGTVAGYLDSLTMRCH